MTHRILSCTALLVLLTAGAASAQQQAKVTVFYPTGSQATSVLSLEKVSPSPVWLNKKYEYQLRVTNITNRVLSNVQLTETLDAGYQLDGTSPQALSGAGGKLLWKLGDLKPNETQTVRVHGAATKLGKFQNCASVTHDISVCLPVVVIQPALKLVKTAPAEVLKCDPIPIELTVTNTGSGTARNVVISDNLPSGLVTTDNQTSVKIPVGDLGEGQSKSYRINAKAANTGTYNNTASASGDGGLSANAASTTVVKAPMLAITKSAPAKRFAGRPVQFTINVANKGDGVAKNAVVVDAIPGGTRFLKADGGGTFANGTITWNLGDLNPGDSKSLSAVVVGTNLGHITNTASIQAYCAPQISASAKTEIAGIPAILLEVIDENDPVEVGANVIYMIRVTNQGSIADTNIKIVCMLEDTQQYVSATGATPATAAGKRITFAPVASLAPKAQAVWRMTVKAVSQGDVRFGVEMTSDMISRPVEETEATNFYE